MTKNTLNPIFHDSDEFFVAVTKAEASLDISSTVSIIVQRPRAAVFKWFVPVELRNIFHGFGPLPAVVGTTGQTGPWDQPGSHRTIHLADGNTAREEVTACESPHYFAKRVTKFTNIFRFFADEAEGEWRFDDAGNSTKINWTCTFHAKTLPNRRVLFPIVKLFWNGYMRVGLRTLKKRAELEAL
jgi:hypothetical protein